MAKRVQRVRHATAAAAAFTGLEGEITVDLGKKVTRVHDGITPGGTLQAKASDVLASLVAANNLSDVADALVAATNLGLGAVDDVTFKSLILNNNLDVLHTALIADDHSMNIVCDGAGFSDVNAILVGYISGAIAALSDASVISLNINRAGSSATSRIIGLNVDTTADGAAVVQAVRAGAQVAPIHQASGAFANPTLGTNNTVSTNVPTMIDGSDGSTNAIFVADNDYIIIGAAAAFGELSMSITALSSENIIPEFFYSIAGSNVFTQFFPTDGTDGFLQSGIINWNPTSLVGHVADTTTATFNIKIVRTRNGTITNPTLGHVESALVIPYEWNKDGDLFINRLTYTFKGGSVYNSTNQVMTSGAPLIPAFNSEIYDTNSIHDTGVNNERLTVPAGVTFVRLTAQGTFSANSLGVRFLDIFKNGTSIVGSSRITTLAAPNATKLHVDSGVVQVVEGDYFYLSALQDSGTNVNFEGAGAGAFSKFSMEVIT